MATFEDQVSKYLNSNAGIAQVKNIVGQGKSNISLARNATELRAKWAARGGPGHNEVDSVIVTDGAGNTNHVPFVYDTYQRRWVSPWQDIFDYREQAGIATPAASAVGTVVDIGITRCYNYYTDYTAAGLTAQVSGGCGAQGTTCTPVSEAWFSKDNDGVWGGGATSVMTFTHTVAPAATDLGTFPVTDIPSGIAGTGTHLNYYGRCRVTVLAGLARIMGQNIVLRWYINA